MKSYVVYDDETGKILWKGSTGDEVEIQGSPGRPALEVAEQELDDFENKYVVGGALKPRPTMAASADKSEIAADGVEVLTVYGVPVCEVLYEGPGFRVESRTEGATVELTTDTKGEHRLRLRAFPYLDWEFSFNAY